MNEIIITLQDVKRAAHTPELETETILCPLDVDKIPPAILQQIRDITYYDGDMYLELQITFTDVSFDPVTYCSDKSCIKVFRDEGESRNFIGTVPAIIDTETAEAIYNCYMGNLSHDELWDQEREIVNKLIAAHK